MSSHNRGRPRAKVQGQRSRQVRDVITTRKDSLFERAETNSRKVSSTSFNPPPWGIKEVPLDEYEGNPPNYKITDWRKEPEFLEKALMRRYITLAVLAVWLGFALICVIRFAFTGDGVQLAAPVLLSKPLSVILEFYYG